jgi:hypothetical protein
VGFDAPGAPAYAAPGPQSFAAPGVPSTTPPPPVGWDTPPLADSGFEATPAAKTAWYKLAPKKQKDPTGNVAAAAPAAAAPAPVQITAPTAAKAPWYKLAPKKQKDPTGNVAAAAPAPAQIAVTTTAKAPWYKLAPKKPKASAAGTAVVASSVAAADPFAPPAGSVPLAVQPPPPAMAPPTGAPVAPPTATGPIAPGQTQPFDVSGGGGVSGTVLAGDGAGSRRSRGSKIALVVLLVVVLGGGAYYVISKRSNNTTTPPAAAPGAVVPGSASAVDTALAASINLRSSDLPTGWTVTPPAQAVVRPPVAPAVIQAAAVNTMAACLNSSYSVVSGLFGTGALPGQTSLVASPAFQSAAGSSFAMGSRTMTLASAGQVQAVEPLFTNPKFDACYQQYVSALAVGAVAGATVAVQPVTLVAPSGSQAYGVVSTYTIPGAGTEVVGDAYMLGGRVVSILQPSTNGPAIDASVFGPAYNAVVGRVAKAAA